MMTDPRYVPGVSPTTFTLTRTFAGDVLEVDVMESHAPPVATAVKAIGVPVLPTVMGCDPGPSKVRAFGVTVRVLAGETTTVTGTVFAPPAFPSGTTRTAPLYVPGVRPVVFTVVAMVAGVSPF